MATEAQRAENFKKKTKPKKGSNWIQFWEGECQGLSLSSTPSHKRPCTEHASDVQSWQPGENGLKIHSEVRVVLSRIIIRGGNRKHVNWDMLEVKRKISFPLLFL